MRLLKYVLVFVFIITVSSFNSVPESKVEWLTFEEAVELHKNNPKKLLIDLYTDWCGWCKVMDRETYSNAQLSAYINENFYPVKFNAEQKEEVIFSGHTFKFIPSGKRGYHELAAALTRNQLTYPTTVFMDEELRIIQPIAGYLKPHQMEPILNFIGDDHYKKTPWDEYKKSHKSSL
ncbi:MAG: DUF255 domain-containing protein [Cyclobacteriaceae bacterium]